MDSTVWNDFQFRDDDIIIATYAKSGTTWTQQIVGQLVFGGDPRTRRGRDLALARPARAARGGQAGRLEAQTHRRFIKTHLPVDALVFSPKAKYLYIGRDGRDVVWSMYNHHANANELWYAALNDTPGRVGPPIEPPPARRPPSTSSTGWSGDGHPFWPFWENIAQLVGGARTCRMCMLMHFDDLKRDLAGEMRAHRRLPRHPPDALGDGGRGRGTLQLPTSFPVGSMLCWLPSEGCPSVLSPLKSLHFE